MSSAIVINRSGVPSSASTGLTKSGTDDRQRDKCSKDIAFEIGSIEQSLHNDQCNEKERRHDEAGESADQDPPERVQKVTRDVLVFTPAPSELVQFDTEEDSAVQFVGEHERPFGQSPLLLVDSDNNVSHVSREQGGGVHELDVVADDDSARDLDGSREGNGCPSLPAVASCSKCRVVREESEDSQHEGEVDQERDSCRCME